MIMFREVQTSSVRGNISAPFRDTTQGDVSELRELCFSLSVSNKSLEDVLEVPGEFEREFTDTESYEKHAR